VRDERKEAERAVACPLHDQPLVMAVDHRFDKAGAFADDRHGESSTFENLPVAVPGTRNGFGHVVEDVNVAGNPTGVQGHTQRYAAADVTLAALAPGGG